MTISTTTLLLAFSLAVGCAAEPAPAQPPVPSAQTADQAADAGMTATAPVQPDADPNSATEVTDDAQPSIDDGSIVIRERDEIPIADATDADPPILTPDHAMAEGPTDLATESPAAGESSEDKAPAQGDAQAAESPSTPNDEEASGEKAEPKVDPEVDALLKRLETRMKEIKTLEARFRWEKIQALLGDEQVFAGTLHYDAKEPAKFAAHVQRSRIDERNEAANRWIIFDGIWLAERDHDQRSFIRRQIVEPDAPASRRNPLGLGQGPFPLPLDANRQRILARFHVELLPTLQGIDKDDEVPESLRNHLKDGVRLRLTPRANTRMNLRDVQLWYHKESLIPLRVQSLDDTNTLTIFYLFIDEEKQVNQPVDQKVFDTTPPRERGWNVQISALESEKPDQKEE
ncbi:MAG: hypothetical protein JJU36_00190 [Phycisphaeraceae bacterium]|nr:hypothetical protein [Phycisphaeraceae bacterium]